MKLSLYILRHGKSDWHSGAASDRDRPLNERGTRAAGRVGEYLSSSEQVPQLCLVSPAVRTRRTFELASESWGEAPASEVVDDIYFGGPAQVLERIRQVPDHIERLLVVGHEPTSSAMVSSFTGIDRVAFPTAALARVDFEEESWAAVAWGAGELKLLLPARLLPC